MYAIQNRQKRTWIVPPVHAKILGQPDHFKSVAIEPGDTALVNAEHWDAIKKDNKVIEALLTGRHLVVTQPGAVKDVHVDELQNHASPVAPSDLTEKDDRVNLTSKVELKEVTLKNEDDAPKEGKGRK